MSKIGKKEQKILNSIARKKLKDFEATPLAKETQASIQDIKPGQPAKYTDPKEMEKDILLYIEEQKQRKKPMTITGLALSLGMDRRVLLEYSKKDEYYPIINKYRQVLLSSVEENLTDKATFTPGQIFYLKNNYKQDYQDKIEIDNKHSGSISLVELSRLASTIDDRDIIEGELLSEETLPEET